MIIDSHAHYSVFQYKGEFPFLDGKDGILFRNHGKTEELFVRMREEEIKLCIEPSVRFENFENQMEFASNHPDIMRAAIGVHPKYCIHAPWEEREKIRKFALEYPVIAIGETGMEYNRNFSESDFEIQKKWFRYQISLARELSLPLILHTRDADESVLRILEEEKFSFGGVVHCFKSDPQTAQNYIDLGFSIGIGGMLLRKTAEAEILKETIRTIPLSSILIETDSPYVTPDLSKVEGSSKQKQKLRNTSLILPFVIEEIAHLREENPKTIANTVLENTLRVFRLKKTTDF